MDSEGEAQSRPTEENAIRNVARAERALKECGMIEAAAHWAAEAGGYPDAWRAMLVSVTEGVGYEILMARDDFLPFTKTDFYGVRRAFYHRLDQLQHGEADQ